MGSVGQSLPQVRGRAKVSGTVPFTGTLQVAGMLQARLLRSPIPHARITKIDTSGALALPGVVAVITGADLAGLGIVRTYGPVLQDQPVLAGDRVRYVGEPVAAVAAVDAATAAAALDRITVEFADLPMVVDVLQALGPDAPHIHTELQTRGNAWSDPRLFGFGSKPNLAAHFKLRHGDTATAFARAARVFSGTYTSPTQHHCALEPHATLARWHGDGSLEVWSSTQNPSIIRDMLAQLYGLPLAGVRVHAPPLGAGYGAKLYARLEPITSALARACRRPVRLVLEPAETFLTTNKHACLVRIRTAVAAGGTIIARAVEAFYDTGAYADIGPYVAKNGGYAAAGPYRIANVSVDSYCVYTNKVPAGAFRGFGLTQMCWAYEQEMDVIAVALGEDPIAYRQRHLVRDGDHFATGEILQAMACSESLAAVAPDVGAGGEPTPPGTLRGRGVAVCIKSTMTPSIANAVVRLEEDGSASVLVSSVEMGQGADTVLAQIAADALTLPPERVRVHDPDTSASPYDQGTNAGRTVFSMGTAICRACAEIRADLAATAAAHLEVAPAGLECAAGAVQVIGHPERRLTFAEVLRLRHGMFGGTLVRQGTLKTHARLDPDTGQGVASAFWFTGAGAADVEVDTHTGAVRVLRFASAANLGRAINPQLAAGQIEGAVGMGLSMTLLEELVFQDGQPLNPGLLDYPLMPIGQAPPIHAILIEKPHPDHPLGAIGVGETALPTVAPAVANAVCQAIGVRITDLPITPEKVLRALRERGNRVVD